MTAQMTADADQGAFTPFRFAVLADPHMFKRGQDKVEMAIADVNARGDLAFVLLLGDFIWPGPMRRLRDLLETLDVPYHAVFGNNDAERIDEYQAEFGPLYGAFTYRSCLFIGLWNSLPSLIDPDDHHGDMDAEQQAWLIQTLQRAHDRKPACHRIFLYAHVPPCLPSAPIDPDMAMVPSLTEKLLDSCRAFAVDACFFGHTHRDCVLEHEGTKFITTASVVWNFSPDGGRAADERFDYGGYRVVHVDADALRHEMIWLHGQCPPALECP